MPNKTEVIRWVAHSILPHEADVRKWLARRVTTPEDAEDIVQQAYCRLAQLDYVGHIANGRAYFFATARSILLERIRRAQIVEFRAMTDLDASCIMDEGPSPETVAGARQELRHVLDMVDMLPPAYRDVLRLRRLEGLSQRETATRLGVSEKVIENNVSRGLRMLLNGLADRGLREEVGDERPRKKHVPR